MVKFSKKDLEELKKAYFSGTLEVRFGEHIIRYRSEKELAKIICKLEEELGVKDQNKFSFFQPSYDKGVL